MLFPSFKWNPGPIPGKVPQITLFHHLPTSVCAYYVSFSDCMFSPDSALFSRSRNSVLICVFWSTCLLSRLFTLIFSLKGCRIVFGPSSPFEFPPRGLPLGRDASCHISFSDFILLSFLFFLCPGSFHPLDHQTIPCPSSPLSYLEFFLNCRPQTKVRRLLLPSPPVR